MEEADLEADLVTTELRTVAKELLLLTKPLMGQTPGVGYQPIGAYKFYNGGHTNPGGSQLLIDTVDRIEITARDGMRHNFAGSRLYLKGMHIRLEGGIVYGQAEFDMAGKYTCPMFFYWRSGWEAEEAQQLNADPESQGVVNTGTYSDTTKPGFYAGGC